ncbi:MAG: ComE operon protein 3 [Legionellaceae bacterium]
MSQKGSQKWRHYRFHFLHLSLLKIFIPLLLGWSWALFHAFWQLSKNLPSELEGKSLLTCGEIVSIPEFHNNSVYFNFLLKKIINPSSEKDNYLIRLSWYSKTLPSLHIGDYWQFKIKVKRSNSIQNPGGSDYERWLFEHGINAIGYIQSVKENQFIKKQNYSFFNTLREKLNQGLIESLNNKEGKGLISALTIGLRDHITASQWLTMQGTGTNHLMAIAGLHIGFVSTFAHWIAQRLWCLSSQLPLYIPAPQIGAIAALVVGFFYSGLAGFALPTQRAVIMLSVFLLSTLFKKNIPLWHAWSIALWIVLIKEPLAILSDSFWLSFGSVAIILYGMSNRLKPSGIWWKYFHIQWIIAIGLIPITLWFFKNISFIGFIANAIAIPWVAFSVLPAALMGAFIYFFIPEFAIKCWQFAEYLLMLLWHLLEWLASISIFQWQTNIPSYVILSLAVIYSLLLIAPRGFPLRWLGLLGIIPLLKGNISNPSTNELWLTALDVGQGLALVIRIGNHVLIYDTGGKYSPEYDMGKAAVIPYLHAMDIKKIDTLIVSHADNDHSGGVDSILKKIPTEQVFTSYFQQWPIPKNYYCQEGIKWKWEHASFEFLNTIHFKKRNNNSCVLKIVFGKHSLLLPGDIEKVGEHYLLIHHEKELKSNLIVAPHHGSRTSSMEKFVQAVDAKYIIFSVGYRNRFHFPKEDIVNRYLKRGGICYRTDNSGAITFKFTFNKSEVEIEEYRLKNKHFWHLNNK